MPIFDYRCGKCSKEFEALVLPSSKKAAECPKCGSTKLEQLISTFSANSQDRSKAAFKVARTKASKSLREQRTEEMKARENDHH